jgi:FkbM family methyltransferase
MFVVDSLVRYPDIFQKYRSEMNIKRFLKKYLSASIWNFLREFYGIYIGGYGSTSYAQEGEDVLMARILGSKKNGFYVDVGAHHPVRFSNTFFYYKRGWRGINIEPNPAGSRLLKRFRPRDINLELGISDQPGQLTYWMFDEPALNTFDQAVMQKRTTEAEYALIGNKRINVVRLDSILEKYIEPGTIIDFMSIDAEGHDLAVLKSNDWTRFRPTWILVESLGHDSPLDRIRTEQHIFLLSKDYELYANTVNTHIYRNLQ